MDLVYKLIGDLLINVASGLLLRIEAGKLARADQLRKHEALAFIRLPLQGQNAAVLAGTIGGFLDENGIICIVFRTILLSIIVLLRTFVLSAIRILERLLGCLIGLFLSFLLTRLL